MSLVQYPAPLSQDQLVFSRRFWYKRRLSGEDRLRSKRPLETALPVFDSIAGFVRCKLGNGVLEQNHLLGTRTLLPVAAGGRCRGHILPAVAERSRVVLLLGAELDAVTDAWVNLLVEVLVVDGYLLGQVFERLRLSRDPLVRRLPGGDDGCHPPRVQPAVVVVDLAVAPLDLSPVGIQVSDLLALRVELGVPEPEQDVLLEDCGAELEPPDELVAHPGEGNLVDAVGVDGALAVASDIGMVSGKPNLLEVHQGLALRIEAGGIEVPQRRWEVAASLVNGQSMEGVLDLWAAQSAIIPRGCFQSGKDLLGLSLVV